MALEGCPRRGAVFFKVQIQQGTNFSKEIVVTTNFLSILDFQGIPNGMTHLTIQSFCEDGSSSPEATFRVNLQRDPPSAPKAKIVHVLTNEPPKVVVPEAINYPPLPNLSQRDEDITYAEVTNHTLPDGTNYGSYQEFKVRVDEALRTGRRRNQ